MPFFSGYYSQTEAKKQQQTSRRKDNSGNTVFINTQNTKSYSQSTPDISKTDVEDVDFEEIK